MAYKIDDAYGKLNLAEDIDQDTLDAMGTTLYDLVESDESSRAEWIESQSEWLKLAAQVRETKSYPWDNSSNVKYPLMTIACMQFHARALPGLLPNDRPVKAKIIGDDKSNAKARRAERVGKFMSHQVLEGMEEWVDDFDRLLLVLPMIGLAYKKTFYSATDGRMKSALLLPDECVVNYHAKSYERARMTHLVTMDANEVIELQRAGVYLDIELPAPKAHDHTGNRDETLGMKSGNSTDHPYELLEVHYCWDLDNDGYKEPYIVTIEKQSKKVLRVMPRWTSAEDVIQKEDGTIIKIKPTNYFTAYRFIPDPNSAVYGIGLGTLLGPTNEAVNSLINQLIDGGTLSNLQSGFLARGAKLKGGATRFRPGEWKIVNTTGEDLQKSIFPMPVREPSPTLFNLLSFLVNAGERVSSVSDMMTGESPGQNQPATTTMAVLEQGLKVFNSIYKRIHRSLSKEYKRLYSLNYDNLSDEEYESILDTQIDMAQFKGVQPTPEQIQQIQAALEQENKLASVQKDFSPEGMDIVPISDPNMASDVAKLLRANDLMEKLSAGLPLNPAAVTRQVLEAAGHTNIEDLMTLPPPAPSIEEKEFELEVNKELRESLDSQVERILTIAKAESMEKGQQLSEYRAVVDDIIKISQAQRDAGQSEANGDTGNNGTQTPTQV